MSASFTAAWLADDPRATALLPRAAADAAGRAAAVAAAAARRVDPAVLEALRARYPDDPRRAPHLDALAAGGAACVVTGQQAGLFGGPLYSIHKAAAAIRDAAALAAETGVPCVPIFWLQSEDHDFAEIATACTLDARGAVRAITLPAPEDAAGCSVAARPMGAAVDEARAALADTLTGLAAADDVTALIEGCYRPERSITEAFGRLIDALFARHGLLVVDPRALAAAAAPVHQRAVAEAGPIAAALTARVAALDAAGFAVQVHVRPGAPLSFYHPTGRDGPRHRIEPDADGWRLCGADATVPAAEVAAALADAPEKFSTSALLRPILQDTWLPTAAYVGGPGEIAYFAQLPPLYAHFGLPLPLVIHRARFRLIDSTADRLLDQLGLTPEALAAPRHELLARIGGASGAQPDPDALEASLVEPITAALEAFAPHAEALDRGLGKLADKTRDTLVDQSRRLVERYRRALAQSDAVATDRLDRLLARLQPKGGPQERLLGWAWYGARYGIDAFVDAIVAAVIPFDGTLNDLRFADEDAR
ncbi:MAG: bacillithiol biosynthesis cysteine-adding enzyme BshC [Myxococcales bacterium]|nr:bacillithiol biosynthesis cysteine-adding enzyme BshC [Myxococcales bacterium]